MSITRLFNDVDTNRFGYVCPQGAGYIDARVLAANVAEVHTVPAGAQRVFFSGTADFYVNFSGAAAVPATDVTDGSASLLNPTARSIAGVGTIGIISPCACVVTMEFYL